MSTPTASARSGAVLVLVCVAQFMLLVDDTIVNLALPSIGTELDLTGPDLSWVTNAYFLTFGGFLLIGGRLADVIGRRRLFALSMAAFVAASLLCGIADHAGVLIAARGLQGTAGAMLSPAALSILLATFRQPAERAKALGAWAALTGLGAATGLLAGGALVELADWRWIFWVNLPIGVVALLLLPRLVSRDVRGEKSSSTDVMGALMATAALLLFVYTVVETEKHGWGSSRTVASFALVALLFAGFAARQRTAKEPLVPRALFRTRSVLFADVAVLVAASGLFAMFFFLTLYMQQVLGWSALRSGLSYLPFTAAMGAGSAISARLLRTRWGSTPLYVGPVVAACGLWMMSSLDAGSDYATDLVPALVTVAFGLGTAFVPVMSAATGGAGEGGGGIASAVMTTCQQIGAALSIAALVTAATTHSEDLIRSGTPLGEAMVSGFSRAFHIQAALMALAAVIGVLLTLALRRERDAGTPADAVPAPAEAVSQPAR
ncbi:MFS transporter [Streptomyces sp. ODS05-4]|uniref:MFS transporter n=1 Tax=Streptomyces sp. ODS05-4 TaxID=2944939 RepID=UPI00210C2D6F|nr:MFS transporter [Streptomyces sp. ODS05-4]